MANLQGYGTNSVGNMLNHYTRHAGDPERVKNDMVVGHYTNKDGRLVVGRVVPREGEPNWGTVERRIERVNEAQKAAGKRATRKDAVVMADVVNCGSVEPKPRSACAVARAGAVMCYSSTCITA